MRRAKRINAHLKELDAVGFRSPLTMRNPEWMQALEIEYDLSFFDTDPYEPMPGGTMSIWPFILGHFVELPYTLMQDYTLTAVLGETTPRLWLQKVDFIERYHGMALVNTHPDYLLNPRPGGCTLISCGRCDAERNTGTLCRGRWLVGGAPGRRRFESVSSASVNS